MILDPPPTFSKRNRGYAASIGSDIHPLNLVPLLVGSICVFWIVRRPCLVLFTQFLRSISGRHARVGSREHRILGMGLLHVYTSRSSRALLGQNLNSEYSFELTPPLSIQSSTTGLDVSSPQAPPQVSQRRRPNSLHLRRYSWSCSAMTSYEQAFSAMSNTDIPSESDSCGYCGQEFPKSGRTMDGAFVATEKDWEERFQHLELVHHFRECNASGKFYRLDHFRQHLKHSHAGCSGLWTTVLLNTCMTKEDPAVRVYGGLKGRNSREMHSLGSTSTD